MLLHERIATLALATFDKFPQRCKPRTHPDGRREWTPMSAIVLAGDIKDDGTQCLKCISLATGTKCLTASQVKKCDGLVLHDSHAEIIALRGLNRWLLNEMKLLLNEHTSYVSDFLDFMRSTTDDINANSSRKPFCLRAGTSIYMFTTTAPCGDASMDLLISSSIDSTPWSLESLEAVASTDQPLGRAYYSLLGAVRRKPARGDAEATMSKSCTDKIALKQFTGLLSFPVDLLLQHDDNIFLKGLIVHSNQYNSTGYERAWGRTGRLRLIQDIKGKFFNVHVLPPDFPRFEFERVPDENHKVTNISAVHVAGSKGIAAMQEVLVNGVKQGYKQFEQRSGKGSVLCRQKMVDLAVEIEKLVEKRSGGSTSFSTAKMRYSEMKSQPTRMNRLNIKRHVVSTLGGWVSNSAEDDFEIDATNSALTS